MTLNLRFESLDSACVRKTIAENYLVKKEVTALIDRINRSSTIVYDYTRNEWRDGDSVIDTTTDSTLLPLRIVKIQHDILMNCSCGDQYQGLFWEKVSGVAHAYIFTMIPVVKKRHERDLALFREQQKDVLKVLDIISEVIFDTELVAMKEKAAVKGNLVADLETTIQELETFQKEMSKETRIIDAVSKFIKGDDVSKEELLKKVHTQKVYADKLDTVEGIKKTLLVAKARYQELTSEKTKLDQSIKSLQDQNTQTQEAERLKVLNNHAAVGRQIVEIENQLAKFKYC